VKIENSGATIADQLLPTNEVLQPVISSFSKKKKGQFGGSVILFTHPSQSEWSVGNPNSKVNRVFESACYCFCIKIMFFYFFKKNYFLYLKNY
jgi:hypothetical protein